jgi:hypothetical protein
MTGWWFAPFFRACRRSIYGKIAKETRIAQCFLKKALMVGIAPLSNFSVRFFSGKKKGPLSKVFFQQAP